MKPVYQAPTEIKSWKTADGELFNSLQSAEWHAKDCWHVEVANYLLAKGETIANCLREVGYLGTIYPVFEKVNQHTKIAIPHWQCKDEAGYQPVRFLPGMQMYVAGDVGAWSGSYGSKMNLRELAAHAEDKSTIFDVEAE